MKNKKKTVKPRSSAALPAMMRRAGPHKDNRLKHDKENKHPDYSDEFREGNVLTEHGKLAKARGVLYSVLMDLKQDDTDNFIDMILEIQEVLDETAD